jgi:hypothetical protein
VEKRNEKSLSKVITNKPGVAIIVKRLRIKTGPQFAHQKQQQLSE